MKRSLVFSACLALAAGCSQSDSMSGSDGEAGDVELTALEQAELQSLGEMEVPVAVLGCLESLGKVSPGAMAACGGDGVLRDFLAEATFVPEMFAGADVDVSLLTACFQDHVADLSSREVQLLFEQAEDFEDLGVRLFRTGAGPTNCVVAATPSLMVDGLVLLETVISDLVRLGREPGPVIGPTEVSPGVEIVFIATPVTFVVAYGQGDGVARSIALSVVGDGHHEPVLDLLIGELLPAGDAAAARSLLRGDVRAWATYGDVFVCTTGTAVAEPEIRMVPARSGADPDGWCE